MVRMGNLLKNHKYFHLMQQEHWPYAVRWLAA